MVRKAVKLGPEASNTGPEPVNTGPDAVSNGPKAVKLGPEAVTTGPEAVDSVYSLNRNELASSVDQVWQHFDSNHDDLL